MGNILAEIFHSSKKNARERLLHKEFSKKAVCACWKGDLETLLELMSLPACEGGLPLSAVRDEGSGRTLLHVAMEGDHTECVKLLLSVGCDVNAGDNSQETPLHVASMYDSISSLQAVLATCRDAGLEKRDMWRRTPLLKAVVYRSEQVMQLLLSLQVDCNAHDVYGLSLAHVAATYGRVDIIQCVAKQGANLNLLNEKMRSPLSVAITACNPEVVAGLVQLGASTQFSSLSCAVVTAARELMRRFEGGTVCESAERVLHLVLAAHGIPLHTDELDVFLRVLLTADVKRFLPVLYKMHICSDCRHRFEHICISAGSDGSSPSKKGQSAVTLLDLARRATRYALMTSGWNVVWAVEKLHVPPALRGLLLLKDCDYKEIFPC